jgi:hypothetical protein
MRAPAFSWLLSDGFWMRLRALWPDRFHPVSRHGEVRNLPAYLLRDIGMDGQQPRDWKRDLF